jgi:hypothetical protein
MTMKSINNIITSAVFSCAMFTVTSCHDKLDEDLENTVYAGQTDYTITSNMMVPLLGAMM